MTGGVMEPTPVNPGLVLRASRPAGWTLCGLAALWLSCIGLAQSAPQDQAASLPDLQQPPGVRPSYPRALAPLLADGSAAPVSTPEGWSGRREVLLGKWKELLGAFPARKVPLAPEFGAREELPTFTRQQVTYQLEEGLRTDAMVLLPRNVSGRLPTVVLFHPTYDGHYRRVVGLEGAEEPERQQAVQLAEAGFAVIAPRCFLWEDLPAGYHQSGSENAYAARVRHMRERHPDWKGITRMTWDGIRALDFAETLPNVDAKRIGIFGHSLGAKEVVYVAAFDPRPLCVVSSEGGVGMRQSNWDAVWYLGPEILEPGFAREHHELLALIAPRPFLLLAGGRGKGASDTEASWLLLEAARPVYALFGADKQLGWFNHGLGHRYGAEARPVAEAFLKNHLQATR